MSESSRPGRGEDVLLRVQFCLTRGELWSGKRTVETALLEAGTEWRPFLGVCADSLRPPQARLCPSAKGNSLGREGGSH